MSNIESEEASNDATIISELLSSAEAMQTSTLLQNNISSVKTPLQEKCDFQIVSNDSDMATTLSDATNQNLIVTLKRNYSTDSADFLNSTQFSDVEENLNKLHIRHVHIPYILNGELYQIQTQDGENVTVKCCHCPPDRVYRGSVRSTGNFHMHIKRRHPDLLEKLHNMKVNALLERRDRLMRNRKISYRNNRNRSNNSNNNINDICSFKDVDKPELTPITLDPVTESNLLYTHKFKIKTVFQRHQMEQREAEEMRNWRNDQYSVMPMDQVPAGCESEQPINYSLKPQESLEKMDTYSSNCSVASQQLQEKNFTTQKPLGSLTANLTNQARNVSSCNTELNESISDSDSNLLTSSISIACPPNAITNHQYEAESSRFYNCFSFQHQEQMPLRSEFEAIDLSMHTDSGIFSSSDDDNDFDNNNNNSRINKNGAGTQKSTTANITMSECANKIDNNISTTTKWHELLMKIENSLRDIQREINVRNQIESNRMFLDIAKFKFLNPGFQFNW